MLITEAEGFDQLIFLESLKSKRLFGSVPSVSFFLYFSHDTGSQRNS